MQISLKRALKLRKELEARLVKVELPTSTSINLLSDQARSVSDGGLRTIIERGRSVVEEKCEAYGTLSEILRYLRPAIVKANVDNGVEGYLAEIAHIDRVIALQKAVIALPIAPAPEVFEREIKLGISALEAQSSDIYRSPAKEISVAVSSVAAREDATRQLNELKRLKESVEDKRAAANASTMIEITDQHAGFLRELGLL